MVALSRFVSAGGDKGHPYFQCLKRNNRFVWTEECEAAFLKLKEYLAAPPVMLVQEQDQTQQPIYFVSKVLQGPEVRYQSLEKATLAVVLSARRLRHYFQSFTVVVMTDLPIQKVLQKPDVAGRMVRCLSLIFCMSPGGPSREKCTRTSWRSSCQEARSKRRKLVPSGCSRWMGPRISKGVEPVWSWRGQTVC